MNVAALEGVPWESYMFPAPIPQECITATMRSHMHGDVQACVPLMQWIVHGTPVILGRAGGTCGDIEGKDSAETQLISRDWLLRNAKFTEVGLAVVGALVNLDLPWPGRKFNLIEFDHITRKNVPELVQRIEGTVQKSQFAPWQRVLMLGDMSGKLDGTLLPALNCKGLKTIEEIRQEMQP